MNNVSVERITMYYWREESPEKLRELYRSSPSLFSKMVLGDHTWAMELCFPKARASQLPLPLVGDLARAHHPKKPRVFGNSRFLGHLLTVF